MSSISLLRPHFTQCSRAARLARQFHKSTIHPAQPTKPTISSRLRPADRATRLRRRDVDPSPPPNGSHLETEQLKKRWFATHLYSKGQTNIYKAPSHRGLYTMSYIIAGSCLITAGSLAFLNQEVYDPNGDLPWFVGVSWRLGIITFTIVGGFALIRPLNMVRSIDLVKKNDIVKLLVQVRRPVAFMRPKGYIIDPFDLKVKQTLVRPMEEAQSTEAASSQSFNPISYITRSISQAIYYPFFWVRKLMTFEGVMKVSITDGEKVTRCNLDTDGVWSNDGQDFIQLTVIDL